MWVSGSEPFPDLMNLSKKACRLWIHSRFDLDATWVQCGFPCSPLGFDMDSIWDRYEFNMDSICVAYAFKIVLRRGFKVWVQNGNSMDSVHIEYGLIIAWEVV